MIRLAGKKRFILLKILFWPHFCIKLHKLGELKKNHKKSVKSFLSLKEKNIIDSR